MWRRRRPSAGDVFTKTRTFLFCSLLSFFFVPLDSQKIDWPSLLTLWKVKGGGNPKMAKIHYGVKTSRKQGGPKMDKIQSGVKPDILKYAPTSAWRHEKTAPSITAMRTWRYIPAKCTALGHLLLNKRLRERLSPSRSPAQPRTRCGPSPLCFVAFAAVNSESNEPARCVDVFAPNKWTLLNQWIHLHLNSARHSDATTSVTLPQLPGMVVESKLKV